MNIIALRSFFMWYTIMAAAFYVLTAVMCVFAGGFIYRVHSRWFPMPRETFNAILYMWLGLFKILFLLFAVVPYVALLII